MPHRATEHGKDWVAILLATGLATAINIVVVAVLLNAHNGATGLSENATQILTGAFGGILGVLGSYIGFKAGAAGAVGNEQKIDQPGLIVVESPQEATDPQVIQPPPSNGAT